MKPRFLKTFVLFTVILSSLIGCSAKEEISSPQVKTEQVHKDLDPKNMTQEELNTLSEEEIDVINGPENGNPIDINKTVTVGDYEVQLNHYYYTLNGIYTKSSLTGHVFAQKPSSNDEGYGVLNVKVTNHSGEEQLSTVSFDVITPNGEVKSGGISGTNIKNPFTNGLSVIDGGFKEGNIVFITPKDKPNLTLRIKQIFTDNGEDAVAEIPLPVE